MRYFDRATDLINIMSAKDDCQNCLSEIFKGDIEFAKGNIEKAKAIWNSINSYNSEGQYAVGERFNRINEYEKAIECFNNSFSAAKKPRSLSAVYSLAFLYSKLGRYREAIDMWQLIIDVLATDYNTTGGETVNWPKNEIKKLKAKSNSR